MSNFLNQFPYSDFHEMNLDWILKEVKNISEEMKNFIASNEVVYKGIWNITNQYEKNDIVLDAVRGYLMISIHPVPAGVDILNEDYWIRVSPFKIDIEFDTNSYNAIANKTVTDKFDETYTELSNLDNAISDVNTNLSSEITSLNTALGSEVELRNNQYESLSEQYSELSEDLNQEISDRESADSVLSSRIDAIASLPEGSTSGDAELMDIRVGYNGIVYASAGDAVRTQIEDIYDVLDDSDSFIAEKIGEPAILITDLTQYTPNNGALSTDGTWSNATNPLYKHIAIPIPKPGCHLDFKIDSDSPVDCIFGFATKYETPENGESYYPTSVDGRHITAPGQVANYDVPEDTKFLLLMIVWGGNDVVFESFSISRAEIKGSIDNEIDDIEEDVAEIQAMLIVPGKNLVNPSDIVDGYIGARGTIYSNATYKTTGFIKITNNKPLTFSPMARQFCVFDTNKDAIAEKFEECDTHEAYTYTPTNDGYIRVTFYTSTLSTFQVEYGSFATSYEEYEELPIDVMVEELGAEINGIIKPGVKMLILGDSYSHTENRYITYLRAHMKIDDLVNLSVVSAHLKDNYDDRITYPYDGRPVQGGTGNNNTINNQIAKLQRLMEGTDLDDGETQIYTNSSDYPDIILIEGGKNDAYDASDDYTSEFWTEVTGYRYIYDGSVSYGTTYLPADLNMIHRTNFGGAMHYQYKTLHTIFPNAKIFFITPSGINYSNANHLEYMIKSDQIRKSARYLCTPTIDWDLEGRLTYVDNVVNGDGSEENPYTRNASSEYTIDSLHPNLAGGNLLGECICAKLRSYGYVQ